MKLKAAILYRMILSQVKVILFREEHIVRELEIVQTGQKIPDMQRIRRILRLTDKIANKLPWNITCLVKVLTVRSLLNKYRIESTVYLCMKREHDKMLTHAWIEIKNIKYLYPTDYHNYVTLKTF